MNVALDHVSSNVKAMPAVKAALLDNAHPTVPATTAAKVAPVLRVQAAVAKKTQSMTVLVLA